MGDEEAFAELIVRYQKMIHALTFRMSGSADDAADLAQEAFLQAWLKLGTFRGDSKFSSWLYRIAVNLSLNWQARQQRELRARHSWAEEVLAADVPSAPDPAQRVQAALLRLPAKQRAAILLTNHEGLSHAEAAAILGCSESTVSWRIFNARRKLKRWLS
jgi:RNA polymerase sigma-70 factor (ECF subfamily)